MSTFFGLRAQVLTLADALLTSDWFHRTEGWRDRPDRSWCSFCKGEGAYHDYGLSWHDDDCPVRLACRVLKRTDPLAYGTMAKGWRRRWMGRLAS